MMNVVSESGLFALILTSNKPAAKRFRKWVTAEVVPAIRRDGRIICQQPSMPNWMRSGPIMRRCRRFTKAGPTCGRRHWPGWKT